MSKDFNTLKTRGKEEVAHHACDIIIPTYNNLQYLIPCINSIMMHTQSRENMRVIVVNNGTKEIEQYVPKHPQIKILHAGKNLGWEGGLKFGLEHSKAPYVCFMNDDTYVPYASSLWLTKCLSEFRNKNIAAVGPTTNVVRGYQNIFFDQFAGHYNPVTSLLIFFCVFVRRKYLDEVGGVDDSLPGGDDLDLSIRFRKAGYKLSICRDVFIYHHGFKTGERVKGTPDKPGGWNSKNMVEETNISLIKKHGFRHFLNCNNGGLEKPEGAVVPSRENESEMVKKFIKQGKIYELGCGDAKTIEGSIGIDRVKKFDIIPFLEGRQSVADIQADVSTEMPIPDNDADTIVARHILEHCVDAVGTLRLWRDKLKDDGRLVISVPDERIAYSIPMNPEHVHAFTPDSLKSLAEAVGLKEVGMYDNYNGVSFTSAFEKANGHK